MIKIYKKNHNTLFRKKGILLSLSFLVWCILLIRIPIYESVTQYGTIASIYENPYQIDSCTYTVLVEFPDGTNTQIKEDQNGIKNYKEKQKIQIVKDKLNVIYLIIVIVAFVGMIIFSLWFLQSLSDLLVYLIQTYRIVYVSEKDHLARKRLDPYGEEDWYS